MGNSQKNKSKKSKTPGNNTHINQKIKSPDKPAGSLNALDKFFGKYQSLSFWLSVLLTVIFGILLFDVKIHEGGDDSSYIEMAYNFMKGKSFPSWHGEFYSILLSVPIMISGIHVAFLKIISFLFMIGQLVFFYLAFKNRISPVLLVLTMLIIAVSSNILFFSSQTYSEALFMFLQSLGIFYLFKLIDELKENKLNNLSLWHYWLILGALIFLMPITRNIGITFLLALIVYFIFAKKYYAILYSAVAYYIFSFPFQLYKKLYWHIGESTISQQMNIMTLKNPYNAAAGKEDFSGMITRFIENTKIYLSRYFFQSIGLKNPANNDSVLFPAIILIILFVIAFYFAIRKNKYMLFIGIYLGGSIFTTFVTLAQSWGQLRMIVVYIPLIMLFLSWGIYELARLQNLKILYYALIFLLFLSFFKSMGLSTSKAKANQKVLAKNLEGDLYYGFTPDWVNFLKMSEWVGKNIPKDAMVASRKPSISFIYSKGREFYGIYPSTFTPIKSDSLINFVKDTHKEVCIFNMNEFVSKKVPPAVQIRMRQSAVAFAVQGSDIYGIFNLDGPEKNDFLNVVKQSGIQCYYDPDSFMSEVRKNNQQIYGVIPDSLLMKLKKNNVEYIIKASLRMNPNEKSERVINTVHRYLYFIELKYGKLFSLVQQFGSENDEPAKLIKINYELYGIK